MESVAELPAESPKTDGRGRSHHHHFTRENASDMARKATEAREKARKLRKGAGPEDPAKYIALRLSRTRAQLFRIDQLIETEQDPQKLDRLVSAQSRLSEQWRIFSGIPLPGSRRPGREKPTKNNSASGPLDAE